MSKEEKTLQHYVTDFKEEIIRMLNSGKNVKKLSKTFGIGKNVLYNWKMKYKTKKTLMSCSPKPLPN